MGIQSWVRSPRANMSVLRSFLLLFVAAAVCIAVPQRPRGKPVFSASLSQAEITREESRPTQVELDENFNAICPHLDGIYEDPEHCDAFWDCKGGVGIEKFCEDGLVFDIRKTSLRDPCDSPHVVNCGNRQKLQEPSLVSEFCPRKFGTFDHPDPTVCNVYFTCIGGLHTEQSCAAGLYFNSTQGSCNWPAIAQRSGCMEKPIMKEDGTEACPPGPHKDASGQVIPHPSYPDPVDCSKFTVCLNGVTPQAASCDKGLVFDSRSMLCALPDSVPECVGWYAEDPQFAHYYEEVPAGGQDPGKTDVVG